MYRLDNINVVVHIEDDNVNDATPFMSKLNAEKIMDGGKWKEMIRKYHITTTQAYQESYISYVKREIYPLIKELAKEHPVVSLEVFEVEWAVNIVYTKSPEFTKVAYSTQYNIQQFTIHAIDGGYLVVTVSQKESW